MYGKNFDCAKFNVRFDANPVKLSCINSKKASLVIPDLPAKGYKVYAVNDESLTSRLKSFRRTPRSGRVVTFSGGKVFKISKRLTPTPTATSIATSAPTATPTRISTSTPTPISTSTAAPVNTVTATPTRTPTPGDRLTPFKLAQLSIYKNGLGAHPSSYAGSSSVSSTGAVGSCNKEYEQSPSTSEICIQNQRVGADLVIIGLINPTFAEQLTLGQKILAWGFDVYKAGSDGRFPSDDDGPKYFHSQAFYLEGLARASLALIESGMSPSNPIVVEQKALVQKMYAIIGGVLNIDDAEEQKYTHRLYRNAAALVEAGRLLNKTDWERRADDYVTRALSKQFPNGTNPERNSDGTKYGFDVNYQAAGVLFASRYAMYTNNAVLRAGVITMIEKALNLEITKIDPVSGRITGAGSTRVCVEDSNNGTLKTPEEDLITEALINGWALTGKTEFFSYAQLITTKMRWGTGFTAPAPLGYCP